MNYINRVLPLIISFLFIQIIRAQDFTVPEFGKLSQEEIDLKRCSFDSTANAVVLFDIGKTKFIQVHDGFEIRFTRHKRIKILTEQGFEYGEVTIPFYVDEKGKEEKIETIKANTYVIVEGEIQEQPLDPTTIYTERINKWWKQKKFVFPNLKAGAILEFEYVHETPFVYNLPDWEFQTSIPTLHSQYQVGMIPFYEYVRLSQGIDTLDSQKVVESEKRYSFRGVEYKELVYTSVMKSVDGFKDEAFITSKNDYIKKFDFQLAKVYNLDGTSREIIPTWANLNRDLLDSEHFGGYIKDCKRFAKKSLEIIDTTNLSDDQKIETLVKYAKKSFFWNGYMSVYASQSSKEFYTKKTGNVAEINLFLIALLREAGFNAEPMILSTRDHGKLSLLYPILKKFNYVLVYVNESDFSFITDGTSPLTSYLTVPTRCINDYGLVVNKEKEGQWAQIQYSKPSLNLTNIDIYIKPDQEICDVSLTLKTDNFEAYQYRSKYKNDTIEMKKAFEENFDEIFNFETKNFEEPELPYIINFQAQKDLSWFNNFILIEPFFRLPPTENMLKQDKRDYPVDIQYPKYYQYDINLYVPDAYNIERIPDYYFIDDELVSIKLKAVFDNHNGLLKILGEYIFKKAVYPPENYVVLKSHFDSIIDKFNLEVILKEKVDNN